MMSPTTTVLSQIFKNLHRNSISATLYILIYLFHKAAVTYETPTQMLKLYLKDKIWVIFQCQLFYLYYFLETYAVSKNKNANFLPCIFLDLFHSISLPKQECNNILICYLVKYGICVHSSRKNICNFPVSWVFATKW